MLDGQLTFNELQTSVGGGQGRGAHSERPGVGLRGPGGVRARRVRGELVSPQLLRAAVLTCVDLQDLPQ